MIELSCVIQGLLSFAVGHVETVWPCMPCRSSTCTCIYGVWQVALQTRLEYQYIQLFNKSTYMDQHLTVWAT